MSNLSDYVCSRCGDPCYYDGRNGDGPVLQCECTRDLVEVNEGSRGIWSYPRNGAVPVPAAEFMKKNKATEPIPEDVLQEAIRRSQERPDRGKK